MHGFPQFLQMALSPGFISTSHNGPTDNRVPNIASSLSMISQKCSKIFMVPSGWLARGVAICNDKDNFNKKIGRAIAKGRASKALKTMKSGDEINLKRDHELAILMKLPAGIEKVKSCYDPFLTDYEKTLLGNERRAA